MRRVFHKLFFVWELEKEEAWINEMAAHGYSLEHAGRFSFEFEETEAGKYKYKTLFLKGSAYSEENQKYFRFLEEMGIKVVCTIGYPGRSWVYTRALAEEYPDGIEIFSDIDSKINYHKITTGYFVFCILVSLFAAAINTWSVVINRGNFFLLNLICAVAMYIICIGAITATVRNIICIHRLKKERNIHE